MTSRASLLQTGCHLRVQVVIPWTRVMRHGLTEFSQEDEVRGTSIDPFGDFVWVGREAHSTYPLYQIIILID